jgi:hypothetical protein
MQTEPTVPRYSFFAEAPSQFFITPPLGAPIWRYMTLPALLAVLDSHRLLFRRASTFEDPFEGAYPKMTEDKLRAWEDQHVGPEVSRNFRAERIKYRGQMVINCWHMSAHESSAMWSQYGKMNESVAIRSTVAGLMNALPQQRGDEVLSREAIFVRQVNYIDYATAEFDPGNLRHPYVHKRLGFEHEREVRAMTSITDAVEAAGSSEEFQVTTDGLLLPVDIKTLIQAVHVSPLAGAWFHRVVCASVGHFGFESIPVLKSAMAEVPIY